MTAPTDRPTQNCLYDAGSTGTFRAEQFQDKNGKTVVTTQGATVASFTDSSTGAAGDTLAAGVGVHTISIPIQLAAITGSVDVLTTYTPGYKFKILGTTFAVSTPVTTADKLATLNLEIGTTNVTGGEVALTSANCTPLGATVAGAAITAANTGSAAATISVEASAVTAFAEGQGYLLIKMQNMDTADAVASLAAKQGTVLTRMRDHGFIAT